VLFVQLNGVMNKALLIGHRTNVLMTNLTGNVSAPSEVKRLAASKGRLYHGYAQDYFIIYKNRFPWHVVPNLVIGRMAYDNFIVAKALERRLSVVDVTKTVAALHQTDIEGNSAGARSLNSHVNKAIIGKFNYFKGNTDYSNYFTAVGKSDAALTNRTGRRPKVNVFKRCAVVQVTL